jgi:acetolactate synthase small subunit
MVDERWVFVIKVQDRPGTLTAIASVFSSRGVSVDNTLGSTTAGLLGAPSTIVLSFRATERKKQTLLRTLSRLQSVIHVEAYPFHARELRSIAVLRVAPQEQTDQLPRGVHAETISEQGDSKTVLLTGATHAVEKAVEAMLQRGTLMDVVSAVMAV